MRGIVLVVVVLSTSSFAFAQQIMDGFKNDVARRAEQQRNNAFQATGRLHCIRVDNGQREGTEINSSATGPTCAAARNTVLNYFNQRDRCAEGGSYKRAGPLQWLGCN